MESEKQKDMFSNFLKPDVANIIAINVGGMVSWGLDTDNLSN